MNFCLQPAQCSMHVHTRFPSLAKWSRPFDALVVRSMWFVNKNTWRTNSFFWSLVQDPRRPRPLLGFSWSTWRSVPNEIDRQNYLNDFVLAQLICFVWCLLCVYLALHSIGGLVVLYNFRFSLTYYLVWQMFGWHPTECHNLQLSSSQWQGSCECSQFR